ncbi:lipase family alpha/beta hydrolase [Saccharopolyspora rosea]|uniref:Lipase family protein n=1 Tax=Saccharopolyspora rosea TaxID=524884 RepID=A0ABW3FMM0_9PSEU|nr:lipase family protein [Saccharopolyspora rosea]
MRIAGVLAAAVLALCAVAQPAAAAPAQEVGPPGANDWNCKPAPQHPRPVVLVHGLSGAAATNWAFLSPQLAKAGYCVFALTYGKPPGLPPITGGFAPMERSAPELADFVDRVLDATGAGQVDLVGHSEGTVMPQYYLKFLGGAPKVHRYVALTPLYDGTTVHSTSELLDRLAEEVPGLGGIADTACGSCREFFHGSDFLTKLNAGGAAVPGVRYTTVMSRYDELVTPYTSGYLPGATNIVLQDVCPADPAEHVAVAFDPHVARLVLNALDPDHPEPVRC